jgi:hypothetical protein
MALGRIGAGRINDFSDATDTKAEAIQCRLHYEQTRNALQRSHFWVFNKSRIQLSEDTVSPAFEYTNQFILPPDFLRYRRRYDGGSSSNEESAFSFSLETKSDGTKIMLTDQTSVYLVYSRLITDPTKFGPLFIEVLVLKLAKKLLTPLAGSDKAIQKELGDELSVVMQSVRALDRNEGAGTRQNDQHTWNDARLGLSLANRPTVANS